MYNDYYLQQIDNKMQTNNSLLNDIKNNQNQMLQYFASGDIYYQTLINEEQQIKNATGLLIIIAAIILIWNFIVRCWK